MERVVGPLGVQTDFNVVVFASSLPQNLPHLVAEVPFDFKDEPSWLRVGVCCPVAQQLVCEGIHAATGFAAADSTNDDRAGEQSALRDDEPTRFLCGDRKAWIVNLPQNQTQCASRGHSRIRWQRLWLSGSARAQREDVQHREQK